MLALHWTLLTPLQVQDASRAAGHQLCNAMVKGHACKSKHGHLTNSDGGSNKENPDMSVSGRKSNGIGSRSGANAL